MAKSTPTAINEKLYSGYGNFGSPICDVGSPEWYSWLNEPENATFRFHGLDTFTARKEKRRNTYYWYAYLKRNERTVKVYLGDSDVLNWEYRQRRRMTCAIRHLGNQKQPVFGEFSPSTRRFLFWVT